MHIAGKLRFFRDLARLVDPDTFAARLAPLRKTNWVVYAKPSILGPEAVLADQSRCTHRIAISERRLVSVDAQTLAFRWKDNRIERGDRMVVAVPARDHIASGLAAQSVSARGRIGKRQRLAQAGLPIVGNGPPTKKMLAPDDKLPRIARPINKRMPFKILLLTVHRQKGSQAA